MFGERIAGQDRIDAGRWWTLPRRLLWREWPIVGRGKMDGLDRPVELMAHGYPPL
jgi:hypothetical protein